MCCRFPCSSARHGYLCRPPVVFVVQLECVYELLACPSPLPGRPPDPLCQPNIPLVLMSVSAHFLTAS